ncbi:DUF1450 domain-containing protein [Paenibacillaceae bacterium]|nr:DUF1450 domain-containing protein [Paenibacillaceae bacterium]
MALGLIVVEVCERNVLASHSLEDFEAAYPEVAVLRTDCLAMCHLCRAAPYAMVDMERVYAKATAQCLDRIKTCIEAEIATFKEK